MHGVHVVIHVSHVKDQCITVDIAIYILDNSKKKMLRKDLYGRSKTDFRAELFSVSSVLIVAIRRVDCQVMTSFFFCNQFCTEISFTM